MIYCPGSSGKEKIFVYTGLLNTVPEKGSGGCVHPPQLVTLRPESSGSRPPHVGALTHTCVIYQRHAEIKKGNFSKPWSFVLPQCSPHHRCTVGWGSSARANFTSYPRVLWPPATKKQNLGVVRADANTLRTKCPGLIVWAVAPFFVRRQLILL